MSPSRTRPAVLITAAILLALAARDAGAVTLPEHFVADTLVTGLDQPTAFALLPDGRVLVTEQRTGRVVLYENFSTHAEVLAVPDLHLEGYERGLLAIAVDPEWPDRPYVYLFHTRTGGRLRLVRYEASGLLTHPSSTQLALGDPLLVLDDLPDAAAIHNGGSLRFGPDTCLYVSLGDDENPCAAQDSSSLQGAILRLWVRDLPDSGGVPVTRAALARADNPFAGSSSANARLVYAHGLRNPFRFHVDPETGLLYVGDVGADTWEEMNEVWPGDNCGWPLREGLSVTDLSGYCEEPGGPGASLYASPIAVLPNTASAIMSAGVYRPRAQVEGNWPHVYRGNVFYSEYFSGILRRLERVNGAWAPAAPVPGQPSPEDWGRGFRFAVDFQIGLDGALWWIRQFDDTFAPRSGSLHRVRYVGPVLDAGAPASAHGLRAAPNPSRGEVALAFHVPGRARARLAIHDLAGRLVRVLHDGEAAGAMRIPWDGRDARGHAAAPGLYLARLDARGAVETARVLRMR